MTTDRRSLSKWLPSKPVLIGLCLLAAIAVFFLWEEHDSHILGGLFWLLLLACPFIHFFMHGRHGHGGGHGRDHGGGG